MQLKETSYMGWLSFDYSLYKNQNNWSNNDWKACLSLILIPNSQNVLCSLILKNCRWNCVSEWVWIAGLFSDCSKVYYFLNYQSVGTEFCLPLVMYEQDTESLPSLFYLSVQYRSTCFGLQMWCYILFHYLLIPTVAHS